MPQLVFGAAAYPAGNNMNIDRELDLGPYRQTTPTLSTSFSHTATFVTTSGGSGLLTITGSSLTYGPDLRITGGTITGFKLAQGGVTQLDITQMNYPGATLAANALANTGPVDMFSGNDTMTGLLGNQNNLHGFAGDDVIAGGDLFDVLNGNTGNDTISGGGGDDWVRGGQGNDSLSGGAGNDFLSGDRGSDTISGGPGADIFNSFGAAGIDRVIDFNLAEGDRVRLDAGSTYTTAQVGADTVITVDGAAQMTLVGVSLSSLTGAWIFVGG